MSKPKVKRKLTKAQKAWCVKYKDATDFEAIVDDYIYGFRTFVDCAKSSVRWFEDWSIDALRDCETDIPGRRL